MDKQKELGKKIRYFRERVRLSQFDLEMELDASPGSISRIENGRVNPTKETLVKIAASLKLNDRESSYLYGDLAEAATPKEIEKIIAQCREYLTKKGVLAYIVDDRNRLIDVSDDFFRFLGIPKEIKPSIVSRPFIEIIFDPKIGVLASLDEKERYETLYNYLERLYADMGFMVDDLYYGKIIQFIKDNPLATQIWQKVVKEHVANLQPLVKRRVVFKVGGISIPLHYSDEQILNNRRFEMVEYSPTSKLIRFLTKIL